MKLIDMQCPRCGGKIQLDDTPEDGEVLTCEYCGNSFLFDDEIKKIILQVDAEQMGYEFERGRQRAVRVNDFHDKLESTQKKKMQPATRTAYVQPYGAENTSHGCLYYCFWAVIGICFFPILLPIWAIKKMIGR